MNKITSILAATIILTGIFCASLFTQAVSIEPVDVESLMQTLMQQIETLKAQILQIQEQLTSLKKAKGEVKETTKEIKATLQLTKRLWRGMSNEDVTLLQEILATDTEVYPEGLITGYFGPLTERAVKRFQKKMGVEQVGVVGPKTFSKINELLEEGAGSSGKVPPGLLIAPGIRKKIGYTPQAPSGQVLPPGIAKKIEETTSAPDTTSPTISNLQATSTNATSTRITWTTDEETDSKVYYDTVTQFTITTSTLTVSSVDSVLNHDLELSGLTASTTYYYLVTSSDGDGNTATSSERFFTTLSE